MKINFSLTYLSVIALFSSCGQKDIVLLQHKFDVESITRLDINSSLFPVSVAYDSILDKLYVGTAAWKTRPGVYIVDPKSGALLDSAMTTDEYFVADALAPIQGERKTYGSDGFGLLFYDFPNSYRITPSKILPAIEYYRCVSLSSNGKIYEGWISGTTSQILSFANYSSFSLAPPDTIRVNNTNNTKDNLWHLALHPSESEIYFTTNEGDINRVDLRSKMVTHVISTGKYKPVLDVDFNSIYWSIDGGIALYDIETGVQHTFDKLWPPNGIALSMRVRYNSKSKSVSVWATVIFDKFTSSIYLVNFR